MISLVQRSLSFFVSHYRSFLLLLEISPSLRPLPLSLSHKFLLLLYFLSFCRFLEKTADVCEMEKESLKKTKGKKQSRRLFVVEVLYFLQVYILAPIVEIIHIFIHFTVKKIYIFVSVFLIFFS